ncbi:MAG: hypothetical protein ACK46Q_12200 [Hyphomonas sp.]
MPQNKPPGHISSVSSPIEGQAGHSGIASSPGFWLDGLIAEGDPDHLISLLHRQAAWRGLLLRNCPASHG